MRKRGFKGGHGRSIRPLDIGHSKRKIIRIGRETVILTRWRGAFYQTGLFEGRVRIGLSRKNRLRLLAEPRGFSVL